MRTSRKILIGSGAAVAVVIVASVAAGAGGSHTGSTSSSSTASSPPAASATPLTGLGSSTAVQDVTLSSCGVDPGDGDYTVTVTTTNHSSQGSDYVISVAFMNGNTQLATSPVFVNDLGAGQVNVQRDDSLTTASGPVTCVLQGVQRNEAVAP